MKNIYFLFSIVLMASCSNPNEFTGAWVWGGSNKYAEESMNTLYIQKLKENNIEYITEDDGLITYRLRDFAKVRLIQDSIKGIEKEKYVFWKTYVRYNNDNFIALFKKRAEEANIRVEYQPFPEPYFSYEFKNREIIYQIEQDVKFELVKIRRESYMVD